MKTKLTIAFLAFCLQSIAQNTVDTSVKLVAQKEAVIKESTIIKIENVGWHVNSELAELRPTISADGNHLFFICEKGR